MRVSTVTATALGPLLWVSSAAASQSPKRGLVYTPNENWPADDTIWSNKTSGLTWYYNFGWNASSAYASVPQSQFEFVPMMWGAGSPNGTDTYFLGNITATAKAGRNITHVLSFSQPDQPFTNGGSEMKPLVAARAWVGNAVPLREMGIKVGLPMVGDPYSWLDQFRKNCTVLLTKAKGGKETECEFDFVPLTSYGNFSVLSSRIGMFTAALPDIPIWVTEFGYNNQELNVTQAFFNESIAYLDKTKIVERYAWFGAFRSVVSNVGPNQAMLDPYGELTDIGAWYLGENGTGTAALPTDGTGGNKSCTADNPCGGAKNAGESLVAEGGLMTWRWAGLCLLHLAVMVSL
ncbi:glycosyl hydrolase catalytic core-domain-containing protein [Podospora appendiculata]|uniref:Glycosyl hydrolase catalytic core-domain-containing protein n=1 Tax=Podospora appendiculata TaxID=314037 RepID=A0AAE0X6Q9_9PEZI|nr:glycosyl hydrolase catalytic core-domain-containing protein [Podospora appendiculata]